MAWSIAEVARMSNTTSRTLRYYHDIGLLEPAFVGANGYRYYERDQLLALQQILLLRELDLPLSAIARILKGHQDASAALRAHQLRLRKEQERLGRLQRTIARTLEQLEGGQAMTAQEYFDGFERNHEEDERELVRRYGEGAREHIAESRKRTSGWSREEFTAAMTQFSDGLRQVAAHMQDGKTPDAEEVQHIIAGHHRWLTQFWIPDRTSYTGLGQLYADDARFRQQFDTVAPGLAAFFRDAMAVYATRKLT